MVNQFNRETQEIEREGKHNRERIYDFIFANKKQGVKAGAIINHTGLSDQAVPQAPKDTIKRKEDLQDKEKEILSRYFNSKFVRFICKPYEIRWSV